ncbi:MAG: phosphoadenosine phosphosulfate reductase family protein, partial [Nitrospira sp.]|nr:phosphoadenosine phosphosulfate reductase family protein [Nitrospira sp.]
MPKKPKPGHPAQSSYFDGIDFHNGVNAVLDQMAALYQADEIPWVIGYSGGKDSTAVLQLVWLMLARFDPDQITKDVHVITTDTLVENPIVAAWVEKSLDRLGTAAEREDVPIFPHRLTPDIKNTFWVNLIGRGYPAPRPKFRWCTERLKIQPANAFVKAVVKEHGEAIMVLGTRKAESAARAQVMNRLEKESVREHLRPHTMLP